MLVDIIGILASMWTLWQPIIVMLKALGRMFVWFTRSFSDWKFSYRLVPADRLQDLEDREAALQLLVEQIDASRDALSAATAKRVAK